MPGEAPGLPLNLEFSASSSHGLPRIDNRFGPRSRISTRTSPLSPEEYEVLNSEFDAILVCDIDIAHSLARRFSEVVLFRDFGRVPSLLGRGRINYNEGRSIGTRSAPHGRLVHVPIFGSIPQPSIFPFDGRVVLRTVAPPVPYAPIRLPSGGRVVNVFAAYVCREQWFLPWLARLIGSIHYATIRVFGADLDSHAAISALGAEWLPRLPSELYGPLFASADVWVYPYNDPQHSHYVPLEAISLGIPCVMLDQTAVAAEGAELIKGRHAECGVVDNLDAMAIMAAAILDSTEHAEQIVRNQQQLLTAFSSGAVQQQAEELRDVVTRLAPPKAPRNPRSVSATDIGPPSGSEYLTELLNGIPTVARVDASAIAWPARFCRELAFDFVSRPGLPTTSVPSIRIRFGDETSLTVGAISHAAGTTGRFSIRCLVSHASSAPIHLSLGSPNDPREPKYLPRAEPSRRTRLGDESLSSLTFDVCVEPQSRVRVGITNALASKRLTVHAIEVERLSESDMRPMTPSIEAEVMLGKVVPVWPYMVLSDRSPGRKRAFGRAARLLRVRCWEIADKIDDLEFVPDGSSLLSRRLGIVFARSTGPFPLRILAIRIGPVAFNSKPFPIANMHLFAMGGRATLMALRVRRHSATKTSPDSRIEHEPGSESTEFRIN